MIFESSRYRTVQALVANTKNFLCAYKKPQCASSSVAVYYHKIHVENNRVARTAKSSVDFYVHTKNPLHSAAACALCPSQL